MIVFKTPNVISSYRCLRLAPFGYTEVFMCRLALAYSRFHHLPFPFPHPLSLFHLPSFIPFLPPNLKLRFLVFYKILCTNVAVSMNRVVIKISQGGAVTIPSVPALAARWINPSRIYGIWRAGAVSSSADPSRPRPTNAVLIQFEVKMWHILWYKRHTHTKLSSLKKC